MNPIICIKMALPNKIIVQINNELTLHIFLNSDSSEEIIPKLNLKEAQNMNYLYPEKNKEKELIKNSYDKGHFNINISSCNKKRELDNIKNMKERENNFIKNKNLKNYYNPKKEYNISNSNKSYSSNKNKSQSKIKKIEFNKSKTNDNAFIKYKSKYKNCNNIASLKDVKTEENMRNLNLSKNTRNNKKFSSSSSKNKYNNVK